MGLPATLVQRSAAARAAEAGASVDDILSSWTGGAPVVASAPAPEPESAEPAAAAVETEEPAAAVAVMEAPAIGTPVTQQVVVEEEPDEPLEPVSLAQRVRTAVRIGAWTGAGLGLFAFLIASALWADTAAVLPDSGPIVQVSASSVVTAVAVVSVLFGAVVAGFSRAATAWANPAMQLTSSKASTAWLGAVIGLVLGVVGGIVLTSLGTAIEGSDGLTQLPVLSTLTVMLVGGAVLGALTTALPQLLGTPVAIDEQHQEEVEVVKKRLGDAMGVPLVAAILLVVLVVPIGYGLLQSQHMASGSASIVAIVLAGGILGFAALAGTKPEMKISMGDVMWAILGLGTVVVIVLSVLFYIGGGGDDHEGSSEEHTSIVQIL